MVKRGKIWIVNLDPTIGSKSVEIESWRREHNEERPKRSHGGLTPSAYAKTLM